MYASPDFPKPVLVRRRSPPSYHLFNRRNVGIPDKWV
jgi:hypothetical protein